MRPWLHPSALFVIVLLLLAGATSAQEPATAETGRSVVVMIGEDEYKTWETLPAFVEKELAPRGYEVRIIREDPSDKHNFPGLVDALKKADLLLVSVRRRAPPQEQLAAVKQHLRAGKALIGIRTASHAFTLRDEDRDDLAKYPERSEWREFDREVLGGNYSGHHGAGPMTRILPAPQANNHPVLRGLTVEGWTSVASLYKAGPLVPDAETLLFGAIPDQPLQPVAWVRVYGAHQARVFYTSLGHESDFADSRFHRMLLNAVMWGLRE